jgi:DNA polymerase elongation subunit (family B)
LPVADLVILKTLKKPLNQSPDNDQNLRSSVARAMVRNGEHVPPNPTIKFVIGRADERELGKRTRAPVDGADFAEADAEWFLIHQLLHPLWRLCEPFDRMDQAMMARALAVQSAMTFEHPVSEHKQQQRQQKHSSDLSSLFR